MALSFVLAPFLTELPAWATLRRPLHVDPSVKSCSIVLAPELSRPAFARFARQAGLLISSQRTPPQPLGTLGFELGVEAGATPVDEWDDAWHDTFVHPNADHPLGGDPLVIPRFYGRLGVAEHWDVGVFFANNSEANYTFVGTDVKYTAFQANGDVPDIAFRLSHTVMLGVTDMVLNTGGFDVSAGKRLGLFSPYVGVGALVTVAAERTAKLDYGTQTDLSPRGFVGTAFDLGHFRAVVEADIAEVQTYALRLGVRF